MPDQNRILLHPLTFVHEGGEVLVGRPDTESYAVLPVDGAQLLEHLATSTIPEAIAWYERTYHDTPDLEEFLADLYDLGFVRRPDEPAARPTTMEPQRLAVALFSRPAWTLYALLLAGAVAAMVRIPEIRPLSGDVFFTRSLILTTLILLAVEIPLIGLHEMSHVLAARRVGVAGRISLGRRLYFLVFQTTMTGIYSLPRRKRILPFAAGMLCDAVVFSGLVLIAAADHAGHPGLTFLGKLAVASAYLTGLRFVWQFFFFMETDGQHLLAVLLGRTDLRGLNRDYLRSLLRRPGAGPSASEHDRALMRWFGPLTAALTAAAIVLGLSGVYGLVSSYVTKVRGALKAGSASAGFWDATFSVLFVLSQIALIALLAVRDRRRAAGQKGLPS